MKKTVIALMIAGSTCCARGENLVQQAENVRREVNINAEKNAAAQEKLKTVKKAVQTQQNVVRSKELILAGKDPAVLSAGAKQKTETVVLDFKLAERKEYFRNNALPQGISYVADGDRNVLQAVNTEKTVVAIRYFSKEEMEQMRGKKIKLTVMVKAKDLQGKGAAKFMLMVNRKGLPSMWPDAQLGKGSFDWKKAEFSYNMPFNTTTCAMVLGLQAMTGTIWFKDLKVTAAE